MKNKKVILLCGYGHGGTNLAWNILQSHPEICSPIYETGEIFKRSAKLRLSSRYFGWPLVKMMADDAFFQLKKANLDHRDNKFKSEQETYSFGEVAAAALCFKSVGDDIKYTDALRSLYPNLYFIGLSRDPYALLEGHLRRGASVTEVARLYTRVADQIQNYQRDLTRFRLIKFEDILKDPFTIATELFTFLEMDQVNLDFLRFKSKKVIQDGQHLTRFGQKNQKYWFSRENIDLIIKSDINDAQSASLTSSQIEAFNREAANAIAYFGYSLT